MIWLLLLWCLSGAVPFIYMVYKHQWYKESLFWTSIIPVAALGPVAGLFVWLFESDMNFRRGKY